MPDPAASTPALASHSFHLTRWQERGLLGVLSAKQMGAERIIAMSRHKSRQKVALGFGATDIVTERGDEGVARIKELTKRNRC